MAIALVQAYTGIQFNNSAGGSTAAKTLTAGNHLVAASTGSVSSWTVSTTPANTISQANAATVNGGDYARLQYAENVGGASTTVNLSIAASNYSTLCCAEWSGIATSSSLDQHSITTGSGSGNTLTSPSVTTTQADELLLIHGTAAFAGNTSAWVGGSSFTVESSTTDDNNGAVDFIADRIVAATASYSGTCTKGTVSPNGNWVCGIATFKAAGAGGGVTGTGAATAGAGVASATGVESMTGTGAATSGAGVAAATGTETITGTGAATSGADVAAATGTVLAAVTGTGAATSGARIASATGTVVNPITGTGAATTVAAVVGATGAMTGIGTIFRPPVVHDRSYGPERLWRHINPAGRGVNVFQLQDGSYVETEPPPGTVILHTYLGGHDNPITPTEAASLAAAGYAANLS